MFPAAHRILDGDPSHKLQSDRPMTTTRSKLNASVVAPMAGSRLTRPMEIVLVVAILAAHYAVAAASLLRENPTIDEVNHLPAGITYWQTGSFKLYHHNPPLAKLWAAWPVRRAAMGLLYQMPDWAIESPAPSAGGTVFLALHRENYLDLFAVPRLMMPAFSILGGLVVFAWSRRLWGAWGGLLSLSLWCLCPNVLAHARLVTSDVAGAAMGVASTYAFWRYHKAPTWTRAGLVGIMLGLAQLTKFSLLLLYAIWPVLWLVEFASVAGRLDWTKRLRNGTIHGAAVVAISVIVIDLGYRFEGVGRPLGSFDFASRSFLTREGNAHKSSPNEIVDISWRHRVNRFRGTWMGRMPSPLPAHYLIGFDEQRVEADGLPRSWFKPDSDPSEVSGYPVYLDGVIRRTGWRSYYLLAILYKTPEGTLALLGLAAIVAISRRSSRASLPDELAVATPILAFLGAMSFLTDINLGLRYVLPISPFLFIFAGRLPRWASSLDGRGRVVASATILAGIFLTLAATASIHPSYLAYFNVASGGSDRRVPHLIDSNLDWGQDLVNLRRWADGHQGDQPIGLAYFGQIPPDVPVDGLDRMRWFLPALEPTTFREPLTSNPRGLQGFAPRLTPGVYAVSASLLAGLPFRLYDPSPRPIPVVWRVEDDGFRYFRGLTPFARIGHSILLFRVTQEQADRVNSRWAGSR